MDLSRHNSQELQQLKKDIDKELRRRHKQDVKEAQKELKNVADRFGLSVSDLLTGASSKAPKQQTAVRFRHPEDPGKGWSGRGRKPAWIKEWEANGKSLEELRVD